MSTISSNAAGPYTQTPTKTLGAGAATRVARTIAVVKWAGVGLVVVMAVLVFDAAAKHNGVGALDLSVLVVGVLAAATVWVILGWFQHTLGLLATIARNTTR